MVEAKAKSGSGDNPKTDAATSGKGAKASATSKDKNGSAETTKSWTEELADGTITKNFFSSKKDESGEKDDDEWVALDEGSPQPKGTKKTKAEAGENNGAVASAGKGVFAGIINGKPVATTN